MLYKYNSILENKFRFTFNKKINTPPDLPSIVPNMSSNEQHCKIVSSPSPFYLIAVTEQQNIVIDLECVDGLHKNISKHDTYLVEISFQSV